MTILFSALATVEYDGSNYYCNEIRASLNRYKICSDKIICLAHLKRIDYSRSDKIDMKGVEFVFINKINSLNTLLNQQKLNGTLIENAVRRSNICIVHVYSTHAKMVLSYARKYGRTSINVVVGDPWESLWNYSFKGKIMAPYAYLELKGLQRDAKYSIYVTNKSLQHKYPTNGESISCSNVDIKTGDDATLIKRLNLIEHNNFNKIKIATLGALDVRYKGQEYVINALKLLRQEGDGRFEYHLAGTGDGSFLKSLVEKCELQNNVFIHGSIPHTEITNFLDDIDVYIQPSRTEGLPRALIEAMSRGCLCLGSKIGGIPELLEPEFVFPRGDSKIIATKLKCINKSILINQAKRNFAESKLYDKDILNMRRTDFLRKVIRSSMI